jgi:hypothetical protein
MQGSIAPTAAWEALQATSVDAADTASCLDLLRQAKQLRGWIDAVEAQIGSRLRSLQASSGVAAADAHTRCGGVSAAEGRRKDRRSETIEEAPLFGEALAEGRIGAEHVDALAGVSAKLDDQVKSTLLDDEQHLVDKAAGMTPEQFGRHCRDRARRLERDNGISRNQQQRRQTFLTRKTNVATGMIEGRFAFHPELGNQIFGAIDRQVAAMIADGERNRDPEFVDRSVDRGRLAAEALGALVAGGHQQARPLEADVTLIVDELTQTSGELHDDSICETGDGLELPPASVQRLLCNGRVTPIIVDANGVVLNAGRTTRPANRAQRRALRSMYRTCAFPDCDVGFNRCEVHHIVPWELGGTTDLDNLLPTGSRHHHLVHEYGWRLDLDPGDRTLTVTRPDGTLFARTRPELAEATRRRRSTKPRTRTSAA